MSKKCFALFEKPLLCYTNHLPYFLIWSLHARNTHQLVRGSVTVPSISCQTGLEQNVFDVNKYFFCISKQGSLPGG